jgi:hypothetical protein
MRTTPDGGRQDKQPRAAAAGSRPHASQSARVRWLTRWTAAGPGCANTVLRALRTLREEGLVEFRRGRGVSVTGIAPQRSPVVAKARELVALARRCGYRPQELVELIEQVSVEVP